MNRIDQILNHRLPEGVINSYGIERAYCSCLTPEDACELLQRTFSERPEYRNSALRKVCTDIELNSLPCHTRLLNGLIKRFSKADYREKQSLGFVISQLAESLPLRKRRQIQEFFLTSQYIGIRRRGYKLIEGDTKAPMALIEKVWRCFGDYEAAWLITKRFPISFLLKNREEIQGHFTEGWQLSRLYLRIAGEEPSVLPILRSLDPISYCYVVSKLGLSLQESEADSFIEFAVRDVRFGLFVWCLGKLGMWHLLEKVEVMLPEIEAMKHGHDRMGEA